MSVVNDEKNNKFNFINERILDKKQRSPSQFRTVLFVIVCAMVFGLVSCLTFYWAKPYMEDFFNKKNQDDSNGMDDENEDTQSRQEADNSADMEEMTTISVEEAVKNALAEYDINIDDYMTTYEKLGDVGTKAEKSMATIVANKSSEWFDEEEDTKMVTSGIIVQASEQEGILILSDYESVKDCKSLMVYLHNGKGYNAEVYKDSQNVGIALIKIAAGIIDEDTFYELSVVDIASFKETEIFEGEEVILMGNPYGEKRFMAYGVLTSFANIVIQTDIQYKIMTTDISDSGFMNGFVMDLEGNIIGMVIRGMEPESMDKIVSAVHIEDIRLYLDKFMSGGNISYLGINGQEVTDEVIDNIDKDMPRGIYITGTVVDSPAYTSGLMNGDILVGIERQDITDICSYMEILQKYEPEDVIHVEVMRKGKDGYKEIIYSVIVGNR